MEAPSEIQQEPFPGEDGPRRWGCRRGGGWRGRLRFRLGNRFGRRRHYGRRRQTRFQ